MCCIINLYCILQEEYPIKLWKIIIIIIILDDDDDDYNNIINLCGYA